MRCRFDQSIDSIFNPNVKKKKQQWLEGQREISTKIGKLIIFINESM